MKEAKKQARALKRYNKKKHKVAQWISNKQKANAPIFYFSLPSGDIIWDELKGYEEAMGMTEEDFIKNYLGKYI